MVQQRSTEKVIVLKLGTAQLAAGTRLYAPATANNNLAMSGFSIFTPVAGSGNAVATSSANVILPAQNPSKTINIIQRRNTLGDKSPLGMRPYEQTGLINLNCMNGVAYAGSAAALPVSNSWYIGAPVGNTSTIVPTDSTIYALKVAGHGYRTDQLYGHSIVPVVISNITSPDFTSDPAFATLVAVAEQRDYLLQQVATDFNTKSAKAGDSLAVCLAIASDDANIGAANSYSVAQITALTPGDSITLGYTRSNQAINLTITTERKEAILAMLAKIIADFTVTDPLIVSYALPTASNVSALGATAVAGFAGTTLERVDMLGFLALDREQAYYDEITQTKRRIRVGVSDTGFGVNVTPVETSKPTEAVGHSDTVKLFYEDTENYRSYTSAKKWGAQSVSFPNEVVDGGFYDAYTLDYCLNRQGNSGSPKVSPLSATVFIPNTEIGNAASNPFYTNGVVNPQKTYFEGIINGFVGLKGIASVEL